MTAAELAILKEGLTLLSGGLAQLETVNNANVKHIATILSEVVSFGEVLLGAV